MSSSIYGVADNDVDAVDNDDDFVNDCYCNCCTKMRTMTILLFATSVDSYCVSTDA